MPSQALASRALRWMPTPGALLGTAGGAVTVAIVFAKGLRDADYFWHLAAGRVIASTGRVPHTDPFSFTWADQPWTPHEWMSELLIYFLVAAGGPFLALLAFGLIVAAVVGVVTWLLGAIGVRPGTRVAVVALLVLVLAPYATVRPQVISWLMMAVLAAGLALARPDRAWMALLLGPFFALWANLHGLWVVGLGVLAVYVGFSVIGRTPMSARWWWLAAGVGLAVFGTMLTPAGPEGILYPLRYVDAGDWGLENIQEWQSPDFHDASHLGLLILIIALVVTGGRGSPGWSIALSWLGAAAALVALRNAPVAAILASPALGRGISAIWPSRSKLRGEIRPGMQFGRRVIELGVTTVIVIAAVVVTSNQPRGSESDLRYPDEAIDLLLETQPDARVIGEYGWGGYLINRIHATGGRVFIDGRNDMYSQTILEEYSAIRDADPGWERIADAYGADAMLFPPSFTIAKVASFADGWCEAYRDEAQVLFLRQCTRP